MNQRGRDERWTINFAVTVERRDVSTYVLALAGEVDHYTAPDFERELLAAIENGGREFVVDLTEASFIDSTFLGVLAGAQKRLNRCGGRISVVCRDQNLAKVFEITGLHRVFAIKPSLEEATASANPAAAWR